MFDNMDKKGLFSITVGLINIIVLLVILYEESRAIEFISALTLTSFGGISAAFLANHLSSKSRISNKRRDKYYEHRNTVVQLEHEIIPLRVDIDSNIMVLEDAVKNCTVDNKRLILRMYKIEISTGLSLKLLDLNLMNHYAEIYVLLKKINSDIDYLNLLVEKILKKLENNFLDLDLLNAYEKLIAHLLEKCLKADKETVELLAKCQILIDQGDEVKREEYVKTGMLLEYDFSKSSLRSKIEKICDEEEGPYLDVDAPLQTFMLSVDVHK